ncbi:prepilin-type N-terminal cleavage/methylation domain-containing protein [Nisaea acidiphila]|uniref:Prepilin-type N-terminal cleavage/methylation domain-containing protein n=1 Tax=Nisaea acidiphila TaxID=1862145 RepID=A0A9J7AN69_9PROT|nr:prepilin-type N-terminal cleavage/methylation domain-containing protein [Nisaea acidiphila]UUX48623.1 prepilin-type N-terminal cleavage/methylation domain-containing protein [Nisaea acidiphila]
MKPRRDREAGFTLLEFLVALALIGLVSVLATGLVRFALDGERRLAARVEVIGDRIALERRLRREMNAVLPLLDYDSSRPESSFLGDARSFRFVAAGAEGPRGRVFAISEEGSIRLTEGRFAEDVASFDAGAGTFSYFGRKSAEEAPAWHDIWRGERTTPRLLRLTLEDGPAIVVAVPVERADQ